MRCRSIAPLVAAAMLLAGCASHGPGGVADGSSEGQIVRDIGEPTARFARPAGGQRLEYRRGAEGFDTYMLDLDAEGRMVHREQVLDYAHFSTLTVGMTKEQVLYVIGHPGSVQPVHYRHSEVWSYRYDPSLCQLFQVSFADDRAIEIGYGRDRICDPDPNDGPRSGGFGQPERADHAVQPLGLILQAFRRRG